MTFNRERECASASEAIPSPTHFTEAHPHQRHDSTGPADSEFTDGYIARMWLLWLLTPSIDTRDATGAVHLGEIGPVKEKNWTKATPYSRAETR
jgi:hypothetical protein